MEGDTTSDFSTSLKNISIHSLRMEGDNHLMPLDRDQGISIHSLRMEGDSRIKSLYCSQSSFQSTPSVWRETYYSEFVITKLIFQSTPSVWRETICHQYFLSFVCISIHSLRMEGDNGRGFRITLICNFNPLPPYGGRP